MIRKGTDVTWNWSNGQGSGTVEETFHRSVSRTLKGTEVTRNGSDDDPALLIRQKDGDHVLKLRSEVDRA
ncbi:DUF2945 domain-containing protein [Pseudooceanicola sp.]|uniref:DUF2945 domain-containing protein n=1 Tax=Pseudooceanicola sp. TaxID=1914328 RepID=UPI004059A993